MSAEPWDKQHQHWLILDSVRKLAGINNQLLAQILGDEGPSERNNSVGLPGSQGGSPGGKIHAGAEPFPEPLRPKVIEDNPDAVWLTDEEEAVLRAIDELRPASGRYVTAEEIANHLKAEPSSPFRWMLTHMVNRKLLDSGSRGFRIHIPERVANCKTKKDDDTSH
jgi:hypothetical protein